MRNQLEAALTRWTAAGLLTAEQTERIRDYESHAPRQSRLPVILGLALGGILSAAGLLLFVSAHWEDMSPLQRIVVLICAVGGAHLAGAFASERSPATSATLHAIGTVALGGAVFLAGQIFNLQENWPAGMFLWAVGALVGWLLLRQWPQLALAAILIPWWLIGEWINRNANGGHVAAAAVALLAICYLSADTPVKPNPVFTWIGGIALLPATIAAALGHWFSGDQHAALGLTLAISGPLIFACIHRGRSAWINGIAAVWVLGLYRLAESSEPTAVYAWCALGSVGMIAWGVHEFRPARVNLGMAGFALTVVFFFFSSVMGKLGRSASLLILGMLFLGGGWYWEKVRRRLVSQSQMEGVQ